MWNQISVGAASENPTLDSLWTSAAEQWREPNEDDTVLLKNLMAENLSGCVHFIKVTILTKACEEITMYLL
jgi:hypothetical protein